MTKSGEKTGRIIWLYGRPCSGKSTIGLKIKEIFKQWNEPFFLIDADHLRAGLNGDLGFSMADRQENIRRAAEMAAFIAAQGQATVVCAFITPLRSFRALAQEIANRTGVPFHPVFIDTPLEECIRRDVKGHYRTATAGNLQQFTGISSPFEEPTEGDVRIPTVDRTPEECARLVITVAQGTEPASKPE